MLLTNLSQEVGDKDTEVATIVHIAGVLFGFFAPMLVYLLSEDEFVEKNALNALNWHIPVSIAGILVALVGIGVSETIGVYVAVTLGVATVGFATVASVKAHQGHAWEYPIVPRFV